MRQTVIKCDRCGLTLQHDCGAVFGVVITEFSRIEARKGIINNPQWKETFIPKGEYCSVACAREVVNQLLDDIQTFMESK
jgi:hypothetical protein